MKIEFADGRNIGITLSPSPLKNYLLQTHKHLQHIEIPFRPWDWPWDPSAQHKIENLARFAKILNIDVDRDRCLGDHAQEYFNALHLIYEKNYDGKPAWHDYHEYIHFCEEKKTNDSLRLRFRDLGGPLQVPLDRDWLRHGTTRLKAGDVYCKWAELGKIPHRYWIDHEPNHIDRVCELVKPWLILRPDLQVALVDQDCTEGFDIDGFAKWWEPYEDTWCEHWQITDWHPLEQWTVIPVGRVDDLPGLLQILDSRVPARRVSLEQDPNHEVLRVRLEIWASWTSHRPSIKVRIDGTVISTVDLISGTNVVNFDHDFAPGTHDLVIERAGATPFDPSQKVEIKKLQIDNLDLDQLILKNSFYRPCYPEPWATQQHQQGKVLPEIIPYETMLGHNGVWHLSFVSPFYPHFLETSRAQFQ